MAKKFLFLLIFISVFHSTFSQITDSVIRIRDYFTLDQARNRKDQVRDSIIANTKTDHRYFCITKGIYSIDHKTVTKELYFTELQKQTDEKFRPFKRIEYYRSGKLLLKGNFFNGDGTLDSCRIYHENGKLASFEKVERDTGIIIIEGIKRPKYSVITQQYWSYNKEGKLISISKSDQNQSKTENFDSNGNLTTITLRTQKQIIIEHYDRTGKLKNKEIKPLKK